MAKVIDLKKLKNYVVIILDKSGSMEKIRNEVVGGFNDNVKEIKKKNAELGMETVVCLVTFSTFVDEPVLWLENVDKIEPLTIEKYAPDGMTAMYDAVGTTVEKLLKVEDADEDNVSFLVLVISDGQENNSKKYSSEKISELVTSCEKTGQWTFSYVGANQDLKQVAQLLNINVGNMMMFTADAAGYEKSTDSITRGTNSFYSARKLGKKSITNMFTDDSKTDKDGDKKDDA